MTPDLHLTPDDELAGWLLAFERVVGDGAPRDVALELSLTRIPGRELLVLESYRDEQEAPGAGLDASASAMAASLAAILERFVADLERAGGG